ncbi:4'-phosphopantetheinyl transferase [Frondihabitans sp. PhB188]|uniref:4'-phosphopantetheinyl transferase family protein n=1 Tax=Frondihabitans sp. PhB188 TaxID=2485200 RepID=UPI000F49A14D|nr:4'-phosphopantetheinyl transferase superfamily protein [Frondihabitans sp. PhB188]ROQ39503.1 4'-phosphopantetheinyl transferase [Frondihabitans sp. PhB188]
MPHDARVWIVDCDAPIDTGSLDAGERRRAARFASARDARRYAAAHAGLRDVLGEAAGVAGGGLEFLRAPCFSCGERHGKPSLADGPHFSLSRSGRWAAIAVADEPVGVDIERAQELGAAPSLADTLLAEGEASSDLLRTWVRKEALLKATGEGLTRPMTTVRADDERIVDLALDGPLVGALAFTVASPASTRVRNR